MFFKNNFRVFFSLSLLSYLKQQRRKKIKYFNTVAVQCDEVCGNRCLLARQNWYYLGKYSMVSDVLHRPPPHPSTYLPTYYLCIYSIVIIIYLSCCLLLCCCIDCLFIVLISLAQPSTWFCLALFTSNYLHPHICHPVMLNKCLH